MSELVKARLVHIVPGPPGAASHPDDSGTRELTGYAPLESYKALDGTLTCKEWADVNNILHLYTFSQRL